MSSRKKEDLSLPMLACCIEFELRLQSMGIQYVRACTYRSADEQDKTYAQGRTAPGRIVTHARGGESPHNDTENGHPAANAADYYPLENGRLLGDQTDEDIARWEVFGHIGEACGLEWGGRWPGSRRDRPHFQVKGWVKK